MKRSRAQPSPAIPKRMGAKATSGCDTARRLCTLAPVPETPAPFRSVTHVPGWLRVALALAGIAALACPPLPASGPSGWRSLSKGWCSCSPVCGAATGRSHGPGCSAVVGPSLTAPAGMSGSARRSPGWPRSRCSRWRSGSSASTETSGWTRSSPWTTTPTARSERSSRPMRRTTTCSTRSRPRHDRSLRVRGVGRPSAGARGRRPLRPRPLLGRARGLRRLPSLLAALGLAVAYHHVFFSQNARGYAPSLLFGLLASGLLVRCAPRRRLVGSGGCTRRPGRCARSRYRRGFVLVGQAWSSPRPRRRLAPSGGLRVVRPLLVRGVRPTPSSGRARAGVRRRRLAGRERRPGRVEPTEAGFEPLSLDFARGLLDDVSARGPLAGARPSPCRSSASSVFVSLRAARLGAPRRPIARPAAPCILRRRPWSRLLAAVPGRARVSGPARGGGDRARRRAVAR